MFQQPRYWKVLERHPLSSEYHDITGDAWQAFVANLREVGIVAGRKIVLHEGKVIDGWQLYRGCLEADIKPKFEPLRGDPEKFVATMNDFRRHETQEAMQTRAAMRRDRVAAARVEGQSLRVIAEQEKVSVATVRRDLEPSRCAGGTPEPKDGKITGKDEKKYNLPGPTIPDRLKNRQPPPSQIAPAPAPTSGLHLKAQAIAGALHVAWEAVQEAAEGSDHVLVTTLEKQRKKLELVIADIDLVLNKPTAPTGRPTVAEVAAYCKERKNRVDAQKWHDHYASNGWRVGKNPMKDWRAAVRTWEKSNFNTNGKLYAGPMAFAAEEE